MGKPEAENQDEQQQDIPKPERILIEVDGKDQWVNAYKLGDAAKIVGKTDKGFRIILENRKEKGSPIQLYRPQIGKGTYILEQSLKDLMRAVPIDD